MKRGLHVALTLVTLLGGRRLGAAFQLSPAAKRCSSSFSRSSFSSHSGKISAPFHKPMHSEGTAWSGRHRRACSGGSAAAISSVVLRAASSDEEADADEEAVVPTATRPSDGEAALTPTVEDPPSSTTTPMTAYDVRGGTQAADPPPDVMRGAISTMPGTRTFTVDGILNELASIQNKGPKDYCILGTRHCSYLHNQIVELLAFALVVSGNHVYTSGAEGCNASAIKGALRAQRPGLLTVILPQSMGKQPEAIQELLEDVQNVIANPQNDDLPLNKASRICNAALIDRTEHLICFAYHNSFTVMKASEACRRANKICTQLYLD